MGKEPFFRNDYQVFISSLKASEIGLGRRQSYPDLGTTLLRHLKFGRFHQEFSSDLTTPCGPVAVFLYHRLSVAQFERI